MKNFKYIWIVGLIVTLVIIAVPIVVLAAQNNNQPSADPWDNVAVRVGHTNHAALMPGPYETSQEVTAACLDCHPDASEQVMGTAHWTWQSDLVEVEWSDELVSTGKTNAFNNFCLSPQSNWDGCTKCHAGYGWDNADFLETATQNDVDCLVCHDQSGGYTKSTAGNPTEGVDLAAAAQSVGSPTRQNCGTCHFYGGGGDMVKHGDLDSSMTNPTPDLDVHMGEFDLQCIDCHQTTDHLIGGRSISVSVDNANQIACADCHTAPPHNDDRLNAHLDSVACQTCHIPAFARRLPTKVDWDWSTAGQDIPEDPHEYLKIKGSFVYEEDVQPEYYWYNGNIADRYLFGDELDPNTVTLLNPPAGSIDDANALIWPFKVHHGNQPYDTVYNHLLVPNTVGENGYWTLFDWNTAFENGSAETGIPYSGEYGFTRTDMWWPTTHMVAPADDALQCTECHSDNGRLDWEALGYPGDPLNWGSRDLSN